MKKLKSISKTTEPTIWIGKEGTSEHLVEQVENQLRARELVKLRLQKSALAKSETLEVAKELATSTGSTVIDAIGHTFTLYKKREFTKSMREHSK